jgi:glutaredoxin
MNVTLYSKEKDCAPCVEAKRFLSANQIPPSRTIGRAGNPPGS